MDTMQTKLIDLISLVDRAGLPLIDVQDDIKRNFKDSAARARILRNLKAIQQAVQEIPRDVRRISTKETVSEKKEEVSEFKYEWPHSAT